MQIGETLAAPHCSIELFSLMFITVNTGKAHYFSRCYGTMPRETDEVQEMQEYLDFSLANLQIGCYLAASNTFSEQKNP